MIRHSALLLAALLALPAPAAPAQDAPAPAAPPAEETPPAAAPEIPKAAPRAPLPADPPEKVRKAIQAALAEWFGNDPGTPGRKAPTEVQGARQAAAGKLEKLCMEWNALLGPAGASWGSLRGVAWWKARLAETQPTENYTKKISKEEFLYKNRKYQLAVSVPKNYRGNGSEVYPLIVTCLDKDADPRKVFPAVYGPLLDTHVVVASYENNLKDDQGRDHPYAIFYGVYWAESTVRIDRDRVVVDAIGKGARLVDELAGDMALQWNGAVFRNPTSAPELIGNLGLYPVCAVLPAVAPEGMKKAVDAMLVESPAPASAVVTGAPDDPATLAKVQEWIAGLKPRRVSDQKEPYTYWMRSKGRAHWCYWFKKVTAVDDGADHPHIKVKVSRDPERNLLRLDSENLASGEIYLNDEVFDLDQPVALVVNGIEIWREKPVRSVMATFHAGEGLAPTKLGPRSYFITAALPFHIPEAAQMPEAERKALEEAKKAAAAVAAGGGGGEAPPTEAPKDGAPADAPKEAAPGSGNGAGETTPQPEPPAAEAPPTAWLTDYAAALEAARKEGKPLLVHFAAAAGAAGQDAVDASLGHAELKADLARHVCARLSVDGEAGAPAKARLEKIEAGAAAPFLAVLKQADEAVAGKLAAAPLKAEEVLPALKKLLAPPAEKPGGSKVRWLESLEEGMAAAAADGGVLVVHFHAAEGAEGQAAADEALQDGEASKWLEPLVCARVSVAGEKNPNLAWLRKTVSPDKDGPIVVGLRLVEKEWKTISVWEPRNLRAEERLRKLVALLENEWLPTKALASAAAAKDAK